MKHVCQEKLQFKDYRIYVGGCLWLSYTFEEIADVNVNNDCLMRFEFGAYCVPNGDCDDLCSSIAHVGLFTFYLPCNFLNVCFCCCHITYIFIQFKVKND